LISQPVERFAWKLTFHSHSPSVRRHNWCMQAIKPITRLMPLAQLHQFANGQNKGQNCWTSNQLPVGQWSNGSVIRYQGNASPRSLGYRHSTPKAKAKAMVRADNMPIISVCKVPRVLWFHHE